jgi:hypothetical protein
MLCLAIGYAAFDLFRTLRSGRARTWMNGVATRERQPGRFWRYVYGGWAVLVFFAGALVWWLVWPESLGR